MGYRTPFTLMPDEECIDYETDVTAGELAANDAYDLYLIAKGKKPRDFTLVCFMNLKFFFKNKGGLNWTSQEKKDFIDEWEKTISAAWGNRILKYLKDGRKIVLTFKFKIQSESIWTSDHWELFVTKTAKLVETSYVEVFYGNVILDNKDFIPKVGMTQRGAVHEFGHMLGIKDEYKKGSKWIGDNKSVMHHGEVIMGRHLTYFSIWLSKRLANHRIQ
jgi:hypothetical protein